ncbi:hypothetical protein DFH07DRAFT_772568 [Mycena maculata]|uniref:Uncharacterized protein n=1 Tax=Mycena maculata TaxID=230809 RepID=A0AAD7J6B3_9AGAR|nr:hypothetical protein DFH07DRAFT_772568 [Mycena maculata]
MAWAVGKRVYLNALLIRGDRRKRGRKRKPSGINEIIPPDYEGRVILPYSRRFRAAASRVEAPGLDVDASPELVDGASAMPARPKRAGRPGRAARREQGARGGTRARAGGAPLSEQEGAGAGQGAGRCWRLSRGRGTGRERVANGLLTAGAGKSGERRKFLHIRSPTFPVTCQTAHGSWTLHYGLSRLRPYLAKGPEDAGRGIGGPVFPADLGKDESARRVLNVQPGADITIRSGASSTFNFVEHKIEFCLLNEIGLGKLNRGHKFCLAFVQERQPGKAKSRIITSQNENGYLEAALPTGLKRQERSALFHSLRRDVLPAEVLNPWESVEGQKLRGMKGKDSIQLSGPRRREAPRRPVEPVQVQAAFQGAKYFTPPIRSI